jgi:glycosyltransferase involved in cell wall biosynthesis
VTGMGRTVICFGSVDWAFNWQVPQEVASGLAAAGDRVLYVENTGVRRPGLGDLGRLRARAANWRRTRGAPRREDGGVDVLSPLLWPLPYSRLACRANAAIVLRQVRAWIGSPPREPVIVLTFLPTPLVAAVSAAIAPALEAYYCADRFADSSPAARAIVPHEAAWFSRADVVFTTATGLQGAAETRARRVVPLAAGVRAAAFEQAAIAARARPELPPALRGLARPIAGFIGSIRHSLDLALVAGAARLAPELSFVVAGPVFADPGVLRACPNVRLLGPLAHDAVIGLTAHFDAGMLPYARTPFTDDLMPVKLKEYLAAGLPVVSTSLPEVCRFEARHPGSVTFADTADAFAAALRSAAGAHEPAALLARRAIARHYDWSVQLATLRQTLDEALADRMVARRPEPTEEAPVRSAPRAREAST